ncbi:glycerophosphoryl diester phosphodiesterase family domain containing protein [Neospora caninum Liverpool]|uniref:Glycerophosphoryl diester phosphodiesterase family domain containing protein n=1 Tax=Neospora caninum (strain Liverpool) TaxID=572307 RepID=F0VG34_NEOCL|nr:glycerophosphoryl diester phosphodiesterase family domain containing protein [Neospora caninum Liverpool]CBZ52678.1 glycerophosphoryl diester phosphodiesterase family domain containing protein [Neospora caninum Liverpool]|eukprot:XP_003882710.1 glycerophosphoryl diester phosphodiesterase family domain containing protein [Neospora caninum Liverpool]
MHVKTASWPHHTFEALLRVVLASSSVLVYFAPAWWRRSAESANFASAAPSPSLASPLAPAISPLHLLLLPACLLLCLAFLLITFLVWGVEYRGVHLWLEFYGPSLYALSLPAVTVCLAGMLAILFAPSHSFGRPRGVIFPSYVPSPVGGHAYSPSAPLLDAALPPQLPRFPAPSQPASSASSRPLPGEREEGLRSQGATESAGEAGTTAAALDSGNGELESTVPPCVSTRRRASALCYGFHGEGAEDSAAEGQACASSAAKWKRAILRLPQWLVLLLLSGLWAFLLAAPFFFPSLFLSPCLLRGPPVSSSANAKRRAKFTGGQETLKHPIFTLGGDTQPSAKSADERRPNVHPWLPEKPLLIGHRGLPELRPENTEVSFHAAEAMGCDGLESDVAVSADGVAFLLHDATFARTTNVAKVFPSRTKTPADLFTWSDVAELNAGEWWLKTDPYGTVKLVDPVMQKEISEQKIPTLEWLMRKAVAANRTLIYDLRCPNCDYNTWGCGTKCVDLTVDLVRKTKCSRYLWWLQDKRKEVKAEFPDVTIVTAADRHFTHDADNLTEVLNVEWVELDASLTKTWKDQGRVAMLDLLCVALLIALLYASMRPPSECPCCLAVDSADASGVLE